jgi:hypothetical protein
MSSPDPEERARRTSAKERVLARLRLGPATNIQLNELCYRYGARILELRRAGYDIETRPIEAGVYQYTLKPPAAAQTAGV